MIRARQQSEFVGRREQIVQFQENLGLSIDDPRRQFLFNIHGDAGVGKTYLAKQYMRNAKDKGFVIAYSDETIDDVTSAMHGIAKELSEQGVRFSEFGKRFAAYRQHRHELESNPNTPNEVAVSLTNAAVRIGLHAVGSVPIAGSVLAALDPAAIASQANEARSYLVRKYKEHEVRVLLSPAEELTPFFVIGLNQATVNHPIALFFDTYERTAPLLDRWLRDLYGGRYGDLPARLVSTVSGQLPLNRNAWSDYQSVIADVPLGPFTDAEARYFLASKNITNDATVEVILRLSGRLPMWLATLAAARPSKATDIGDPAGEAVERFFKWEDDPSRRAIALSAALPRALNQDVFAVIAPPDTAREQFRWLCGLPFVSAQLGWWKYHEVVRAAMLRWQRSKSPSEWRINHLNLAKAHDRSTSEAGASAENWDSQNWVDHKAEETYHLLCADPVGNLPLALIRAVKVARSGAARALQWADLFADAGRDADDLAVARWGEHLRSGIEGDDLIDFLTYLINNAQLDRPTLTIAFTVRGKSYVQTSRYGEAVSDFTQVIDFNNDHVPTILERSQTYIKMRRYEEALADLIRVRELDPDNAAAIIARGHLYLALGRQEEALADFSRAIELIPEPVVSEQFLLRGQSYLKLGRREEALADYTCAIERGSSHHISAILPLRAFACMELERYEEAAADFTRAIELDHDSHWTLPRGSAYLELECYEEAAADFTRAIELYPDSLWAVVCRSSAYLKLERYEEARADLTRAIELNPDSVNFFIARGHLYMGLGRQEEALPDFSRAIEFEPSNTDILLARGGAYQRLERYEEAEIDFTRAIELDPNLADVIGMDLARFRDRRQGSESVTDS
jgi:tetratricopeptide (TPR) repeat protein